MIGLTIMGAIQVVCGIVVLIFGRYPTSPAIGIGMLAFGIMVSVLCSSYYRRFHR